MDDLPPGVSDREPYRSFTDTRGEINGPSWLDITTVSVTYVDLEGDDYVAVHFDLAGHHPLPIPDRSEEWIAYGLVVDVDGDGMADVRFGIDNLSSEEHRVWRTDLVTEETEHHDGPPHGPVADTFYPGQHQRGGMTGSFSIERQPGETEFRFYVWASAMQGSQVVATDYAPDNGWIDRPMFDRSSP